MFAEGNFLVTPDQFYRQKALRQYNNASRNKKQDKQKQKIRQFLSKLDQQHNSEDEGIEDYKIGGYHPVHIGQVLINRYVVIQKLGWGHFSTVWLCKDFKHNNYVAVKIQKSSPNYMEAAFDQVQILQKIQKMSQSKQWQGKNRQETHVVGLLNAFIHKTFYGNHFCMVFQILRCNLLEIIKRYNYQGIPIKICQQITKQVLQGLDYLHRVCGIIHTDLKPENVMLCLSKQQLNQIVQHGQLNSHELFAQRTKIFREYMGLANLQEDIEFESKLQDLQQKLKNQNLSKNQKKNLKKKLKKQLQKQQSNKNIQNQIDGQKIQDNQELTGNTSEKKVKSFNISDIFDVHKGKIQINRGNKLRLPLRVKIADLGNACWKHHHFSSQIQTRQYRSPEVILGQSYNQTADIWSLACMMYEMLTGDLLFQPRKTQNWGKNDDHLAQMQQLLGPFDISFISRSPKMRKYFQRNGKMKRFPTLNHYSLSTVMQLKNRLIKSQADKLSQFLLPMMTPQPQKRAKAYEALNHSWLKIKTFKEDYKMSQQQHQILKKNFYDNQANFRQIIQEKQKYDASEENNCEMQQKVQSTKKRQQKYADIRYVDRSFTDLGYIGYSDGIDFKKLDKFCNWQFK